jgi:pyruvate dehydrogenase E2 component (dihydrolipoamide acetyltransferase)
MPTPVIMPKYEMSQETGKIARWLKAEGDAIEKGEPILEIETDKTNIEVEARAGGILVGICAEPGQVFPVGQPIAYIVKPGEAWPPASAAPAAAAVTPVAPAAAAAQQEGSVALRATPIAERMAAEHGIDLRAVVATGPGGRITREDVEAHLAAQAAPPSATDGKVKAVPAARRLARELGVDLISVAGTGPGGRIQSEDVEQAAKARNAAAEPSVIGPQPIATSPETSAISYQPSAISYTPAVRRVVPLTNIRRTIAERMTQSVREAPQFTVEVDVDMGRAMAIVQDFRDGAGAAAGPKVTVTALLVKVCAWALTQFPAANSMFEADQLVEWDEVNIGVATAIEQGLIVPVVHGADRLGMKEIAGRLAELTARARENRLKLEDLQGGTFTISNLGMFGTDRFSAILNPPQAAILAVGRVAKRAMVGADDRIEVRQMASLALTADHRVLDGAAGAQFLALIQRALEHPGLLLG